MPEQKPLVLEMFTVDSFLNMSAFEPLEFASTLRHFSQVKISSDHIVKLCDDMFSVLNKPRTSGEPDEGPLNSLKKTGELLWDQLLTLPVKQRLKNSQPGDLLLLMDEELINIPWELLYDGEEFLCLKFNIGRLLRTKQRGSPPNYRNVSSKLRMLILADPTGDLHSAYEEGVSIRNTFDNRRQKLSIDLKTTGIDTLFVKKNLGEYDIVHYAGHCECDKKHPDNSGWILSDATLTSRDILTMGETFRMPSLVFSNSCQSAQAQKKILIRDYQERTYSLASAFLFSGVRHYIGAVWRIQDHVSLVFATEFYHVLRRGRSVGEAIRLSRIKLVKAYGMQSFFWASYLLYGAPGFVLFRKPAKPAGATYKQHASRVLKHRKALLLAGLCLAVIVTGAVLYCFLPSVNPSSYFLLKKASWNLDKGMNKRAQELCAAVLRKNAGMIGAYPVMAEANSRMGKRGAAIQNYFDYAIEAGRKENLNAQSFAYCMIGWLYQQQGKYSKAFDFYQKSISQSRACKDKLNEAIATRKLAVWYMDKEENDEALELLTKSADINNERQSDPAHRYNLACDYFDLGLLFVNKGDLPAAKDFYLKAQKIFARMKKFNEMSDYYFNQGEINLIEKDYSKVLDCYLRGLDIDRAQNNLPNISQDYNMIGELYAELDDPVKAEEYFMKSLELCDPENMAPELAAASYNLGLLYKKRGHKRKAQTYLRKAEEIYVSADYPGYTELRQELLTLW